MKKTIFKYKYPLLIIAVFAVGFLFWNLPVSDTVYAQTYGVIANDDIDDTSAINDAINELKQRGGGKLVFPAGQVIISDRLNFNAYGNFVSYEILGDGTEILVNGDAGDVIFYFGNNDRVRFDGLTFVGRNVYDPNHPQYVDCGYLIFANYVDKLIIQNTSFIGIRADVSIVYTGIADAVIENSNFGGSSGRFASVEAGATDQFDNWFRGLTVRNTTFLDYGNYRDTNYWKSSNDNSFWIKAESNVQMRDSVNAMHQRLLRIEDSRFDEAATVAVGAKNVEFVKIEGISVNVNSSGTSRGVDLSGVHYGEVNFSRFGYTGAPRPAVKASDRTMVNIKGITLGGGVVLLQKDASSRAESSFCFGDNCSLGNL